MRRISRYAGLISVLALLVTLARVAADTWDPAPWGGCYYYVAPGCTLTWACDTPATTQCQGLAVTTSSGCSYFPTLTTVYQSECYFNEDSGSFGCEEKWYTLNWSWVPDPDNTSPCSPPTVGASSYTARCPIFGTQDVEVGTLDEACPS